MEREKTSTVDMDSNLPAQLTQALPVVFEAVFKNNQTWVVVETVVLAASILAAVCAYLMVSRRAASQQTPIADEEDVGVEQREESFSSTSWISIAFGTLAVVTAAAFISRIYSRFTQNLPVKVEEHRDQAVKNDKGGNKAALGDSGISDGWVPRDVSGKNVADPNVAGRVGERKAVRPNAEINDRDDPLAANREQAVKAHYVAVPAALPTQKQVQVQPENQTVDPIVNYSEKPKGRVVEVQEDCELQFSQRAEPQVQEFEKGKQQQEEEEEEEEKLGDPSTASNAKSQVNSIGNLPAGRAQLGTPRRTKGPSKKRRPQVPIQQLSSGPAQPPLSERRASSGTGGRQMFISQLSDAIRARSNRSEKDQ